VAREERQLLIREALTKLDERCRELIRALFFEPAATNYQVLAAKLGMQVGSIGPTRQRCFKKLEGMLGALAV
jgi:DNA-directed RNA polymerase specialized sigma24 family protein